jgi:hypothetical protein
VISENESDLHEHWPGDLAEIMTEVLPPDGTFGHRQHIHLAYLAVRRYGTDAATELLCHWIQQIAAYQRAPQKYNATVTTAWTQIVAHHADSHPAAAGFAEFADRFPALLDKRLLSRHYRPATLASPAARSGWVPPDLAPFPWRRAGSDDGRMTM